jgi:hypothetical protein
MRTGSRSFNLVLVAVFAAMLGAVVPCHGQAALLMEEPYGFFGAINPTGHNAIYFANICAETPTRLRRCGPGELGSVIARYQGVDGYDWIAIPLIPYLYSVETIENVPNRVSRAQVKALREAYRAAHFTPLGMGKRDGNLVHEGWDQLVGVSFERRIFAFRFHTTAEQDDAVIAQLNDRPNKSHFETLFNNCADFARKLLNMYFPNDFHRSIFPDAGITTPKEMTYRLVRWSRKHPEEKLEVFEIPQIPGYRRHSRSNKNIAESFTTTAYAIPLTLVNPYLAGCIFVDYLARGRFHLIPRNPRRLEPKNLAELTGLGRGAENSADAASQAGGAAPVVQTLTGDKPGAESGPKESSATQ